MKDDSSLNGFVKRMWELHDEKDRHLAVGPFRTLESSQFAVVQWVGQLMATLSAPHANVPPEFHLRGTLDMPAGRPYTPLYEIVRAARAVS